MSNNETDNSDPHREIYEVSSLIADTAQHNVMKIGSKEIEFDLYIDENMPARFAGDGSRIKQIMNNILSNALRFTKAGFISLTVTAVDNRQRDDEVILHINITDTGKGMTQEQVDELFNSGSKDDENETFIFESADSGMKSTIRSIQMMNGQMTVVSKPGSGSTFIARIPQCRVDQSILGKESVDKIQKNHICNKVNLKSSLISHESMPYGKVLVVDDISTNILIARGLLNPYDLKIDAALSGMEAIRKIREGNKYDIIFMDQMMPEMDGMETTRQIRDLGYDQPIVALTANSIVGQAGVFLENGFDDFMTKPVDVLKLNNLITSLIRDKQPHEVIENAQKQ